MGLCSCGAAENEAGRIFYSDIRQKRHAVQRKEQEQDLASVEAGEGKLSDFEINDDSTFDAEDESMLRPCAGAAALRRSDLWSAVRTERGCRRYVHSGTFPSCI